MIKKKSLLLTILTCIMFICLTMAFVFIPSVVANAAEEEAKEGKMIGASMRVVDANAENAATVTGLRFGYVIDKNVSGITVENGKLTNVTDLGINLTVGGTTTPIKFYENGTESTDETKRVNVGTYNAATKEFVVDANGNDLLVQLYIYNFDSKEDYNLNITAQGYVKVNGDEAASSPVAVTRSMRQVAKLAYQDTKNADKADLLKLLKTYLEEYTVTFNTNGGTAVEAVTVVEGSKISATTTLEGYEFTGWTANGTPVDLSTYTVEGNVTLNANFKKSVAIEGIMSTQNLVLAGVSTFSKVMVGDSLLTSSDYEVTADGLKITKTLSNGSHAIKVYENEYVYTEYSVSLVDVTKATDYTAIDTENIVTSSYGDSKSAQGSTAENPMGKTGTYFVSTVEKNNDAWALKVKPTVSLDVLKAYGDSAYLAIEYYADVDVFSTGWSSGNRYVGYVNDGDDTCAGHLSQLKIKNAWQILNIPLSTIIDNFETLSAMGEDDKKACLLMNYAINGDSTGEIYVGGFKIVPNAIKQITPTEGTPVGRANIDSYAIDETTLASLQEAYGTDLVARIGTTYSTDDTLSVDLPEGACTYEVLATNFGFQQVVYTVEIVDNTAPVMFTSLDTDYIKGAQYGGVVAGATEVGEYTVGEKTGTFAKVNFTGSNIKSFTLKVTPTVSKETLNLYKGGYIAVEYYIDVADFATNKQMLTVITGEDEKSAQGSPITFAKPKTWGTVLLPVSLFTDNDGAVYDDFTDGKGSWSGALLYFQYNTFDQKTGDVYFGNFKVLPAGSALPASQFTALSTDNVRGAHYDAVANATTTIKTTTVGDRTGTFVQVDITETNSFCLKVAPTISKEYLSYYKGGSITIDYYVGATGFTPAETIKTVWTDDKTSIGNGIAGSTIKTGEWATLSIEITAELLDGWDTFISKDITKNYWTGILFYFGYNCTANATGNIYFTNFQVVSAN